MLQGLPPPPQLVASIANFWRIPDNQLYFVRHRLSYIISYNSSSSGYSGSRRYRARTRKKNDVTLVDLTPLPPTEKLTHPWIRGLDDNPLRMRSWTSKGQLFLLVFSASLLFSSLEAFSSVRLILASLSWLRFGLFRYWLPFRWKDLSSSREIRLVIVALPRSRTLLWSNTYDTSIHLWHIVWKRKNSPPGMMFHLHVPKGGYASVPTGRLGWIALG